MPPTWLAEMVNTKFSCPPGGGHPAHRLHLIGPAGERRGGVDDDPRPLEGQQAAALGVEPEVVADLHPDGGRSGCRTRSRAGTGPKRHPLGHERQRPQVQLAVRAEDAFGADHRGGVVEGVGIVGILLDHAHHQVHVVVGGQPGQSVHRRPRHRLSQRPVQLARPAQPLAVVAVDRPSQRLLRKHQQPHLRRIGRLGNPVGHLAQIGPHIPRHRREIHRPRPQPRLIAGIPLRNHPPIVPHLHRNGHKHR